MKIHISLLVLFISLLFSSCTKDTPLSANNETGQGGISLNIDRVHKPANVVSVTAYLTREGYDTLSGTLNLISDTTADITFNEIAAGSWHLIVDAADEDTVVVYSGSTDVTILAGITTQVSLVLQPTGEGKGNIYIYVTWGVPPNLNWIDSPDNPIMTQSIVPDYPLAVTQPKVILDDGVYKMWFTSLYWSAVFNIWYAVSNDGINWQLGSNSAVLTPGNYNTWDSHAVGTGAILKEDNVYKMYYSGFSDEYGYWNIGLATSSDGINWIKQPNPVIYADADEYQISPNDIVKVNGTYYLYYSKRAYPYYDIRVATSTDGVNFTKPNNNPLLVPAQNWEGTGIFSPSVIYENGIFKMIYVSVGGNGTDLGMATSNDGIHWTKDPNNPFFTINEVHNNWCQRITYPFWRKINGQYRIYYTGNMDDGYYSAMTGLIYK